MRQKKHDPKAMMAWLKQFAIMACDVGTDDTTAGERGLKLTFDPATQQWTLEAWVHDSFAWSGESSCDSLAELPALFDEENL